MANLAFCFLLDTNECLLGTHNCSRDSSCINTNGSYYCTCNKGYAGNGFTCTGMYEWPLEKKEERSRLYLFWIFFIRELNQLRMRTSAKTTAEILASHLPFFSLYNSFPSFCFAWRTVHVKNSRFYFNLKPGFYIIVSVAAVRFCCTFT